MAGWGVGPPTRLPLALAPGRPFGYAVRPGSRSPHQDGTMRPDDHPDEEPRDDSPEGCDEPARGGPDRGDPAGLPILDDEGEPIDDAPRSVLITGACGNI